LIYLVRHGQTEFNLARRHHGHSDSPRNVPARRLPRGLTGTTP
jgi:broad specificity phosphatase PhoE